MTRSLTPQAIARGLTTLFTGLWYLLFVISVLIALLFTWGVNVGVQLGPNGEPNFDAGGKAEMLLPVAFELNTEVARVISADLGRTGAIEDATGMLRFTAPQRPWLAATGAAVMIVLGLWILAELAALCRSVRNRHPFAPVNAVRIRRLALALVLAEVWRAALSYYVHAYAAAHFTSDHLRFTAWPDVNASAIVSALILLVLAEVFRTGTRLDEEQSLTV